MRTLSSGAPPLCTPPTLLHGFLGDGLRMLGLLQVHLHPCICLQLSQMGGSQCSWNAYAGVLEGCCTQSPKPSSLCRLQLVLALTMHQPPWH